MMMCTNKTISPCSQMYHTIVAVTVEQMVVISSKYKSSKHLNAACITHEAKVPTKRNFNNCKNGSVLIYFDREL